MSVAENKKMKPILDMEILTDKRLKSNRSDITLVNKNSHEWILIEVGVHGYKNTV